MAGYENSTLFSRTDSTATSLHLSGRTMTSNEVSSKDGDSSSTRSQTRPRKPFVTKSNGRTYLSESTPEYALPVDLHELHRQTLKTLLLFQVFGGPVCSPALANKPPTRVLDVGCGYGYWSMMCHSYYSRKGHSNISFTGLDLAPLGGLAGIPNNAGPSSAPKDGASTLTASTSGHWTEAPPDRNMRWNFVQHDVRKMPFPFPDEEFDLIMSKDMCLVVTTAQFPSLLDEFMRLLKPGGTLEVWDSDDPIRMLRPHVPDAPTVTVLNQGDCSTSANGGEKPASSKKADHEKEIAELGAYVVNNNTPLSGPQNNYLIEYNGWISKYLEKQGLLNFPCTHIGPYLIQEPLLTNHGMKRLAIPLAEVRWEREGVGGVVTKDGKSYIDTSKAIGRAAATASKSSAEGKDQEKKKALSAGQLALRESALQTVVEFVESMEPALREISGKKADEWDVWMSKFMKELMERDGANCGECLEVGAWWSRKRQNPP